MPSKLPVPTLSSFGWVRNPAESVDFLLVHMFYSDKFQTSLYGNNVTSIQWILEEASGSIETAVASLRQAINNYMSRYYDSAIVEVSYRDEDPEKSTSKVQISLAVRVIEDGMEYQVSRMISLVDGRFKEFIDLNNETGVSH